MTGSDPQLERRVLDLFQALLDLPERERIPWIEAHSDVDSPLRNRLMAMLAGDRLANLRTGGGPGMIVEERLPERVGAYRITGMIGQGGMGAVYRGERDAGDFDHVAAIKLIRPGALSDTLVERFQRERQTLAQLNHPHIARLYDGGETPDGAPYLVMEYVAGHTLSAWAANARADQAARVALFLQICDAVEYAHQHLIVHRDLTPSNILVTEAAEAKLIDFGIARPQVEAEDGAVASAFSGLSLTPGFAAPERMAGAAANTLLDIFSLGKILRALLGDAMPGELAAIAGRAQAEDPAARYPTVSALKAAVIDWQERRPIAAFSSTPLYRLRKFVDRERVLVGAGAAISIALIGGLIATGWAYRRAESERANAEQRFAETRSLSKYLIDDVVSDLEAIPGTATMRQTIAERGRTALERLSAVPNAPADLVADTATAYRQIGESLASPDFRGTGSADATFAALAKAEAMHRQLVRDHPERADFKLALAKTLSAHAFRLVVLKNDTKRAATLLEECEALLGKLPQTGKDVLLARLSVATARGHVYDMTSDYTKAYAHSDTSVALARRIKPSSREEAFAVASALNTLYVQRGDALWYDRDDKAGALAAYQASLKSLDAPELASDIRVIKMQVFGATNMASTLFELGRTEEALRTSRAGIELAKRMRLFDDSIRSLHLQAASHGEYALELYALKQMAAGDAQAKVTLDIRRELARRMPDSYEAQRLIPVAQRPLGEALEELGQNARACGYYRQAISAWDGIARSGHKIGKFDQVNEVDWLKKRIGNCA